MILTTKQNLLIHFLNKLVDCDLFKAVNVDDNYFYFKPKLIFKGSNRIESASLEVIKSLKDDGDFILYAQAILNEY